MLRRQKKSQVSVEVATDALEIAKAFAEVADGSTDVAKEAIETVRDTNTLLGRVATLHEGLFNYVREAQPLPDDALTIEELEIVGELYPQWTISVGVSESGAAKRFTRSLHDLDPNIANTRDTYLRFADSEYFDFELAQIFGQYSGHGDLGSFPHFTITTEASPIGHADIVRIDTAERYLADAGLLQPQQRSEASAAC